MDNLASRSTDDLRALRAGHLRTLDDILVNDVFITVPTARLLVDAIHRIDAILASRS